MKRILLAATLLLLPSAFGDYELPPEMKEDSTPSDVKIYSNVSLNITRISGVDDVGFGLTTGADLVWHFASGIGLFGGADYAQIKGEEQNQKVSVDYIDIPFGLSFGVAATNYSKRSHIINLGLFYGLPIGDLKVGSAKIGADPILGLNFEGHSNFRLTENFWLGFHVQVKYGFQDIVADNQNTIGTSSKPLTTALGVSARFL